METAPPDVLDFLAFLKASGSVVEPELEAGGAASGEWWIDFPGFTVQWRRDFGFGFSIGPVLAYGEGPSEIFKKPKIAADRARQLLAPHARGSFNSLKAIRELFEVTQDQLARRMRKKQASVSRLEHRSDPRIETLSEVIEALGGRLELRAIFPEASLPIYRDTENNDAPSQSRSTAGV